MFVHWCHSCGFRGSVIGTGAGLLKYGNSIWENRKQLLISHMGNVFTHTIPFNTAFFMAWLRSAHFMNQKTDWSSWAFINGLLSHRIGQCVWTEAGMPIISLSCLILHFTCHLLLFSTRHLSSLIFLLLVCHIFSSLEWSYSACLFSFWFDGQYCRYCESWDSF